MARKGIKDALVSIMEDEDRPSQRVPPRQKTRLVPEAFPDYGKSLVSQEKASPVMSGITQATTYGALGSILGALAGRLTEQDRNRMLAMALLGGLVGAGTGYYSGKRQRESENSRLYFLRRMGISTPGELAAASEYPGLARKLTEEGYQP